MHSICPIKDISIFIQTCTCMLNQLQLQLKPTHLQTLFFRLQAFQVYKCLKFPAFLYVKHSLFFYQRHKHETQ